MVRKDGDGEDTQRRASVRRELVESAIHPRGKALWATQRGRRADGLRGRGGAHHDLARLKRRRGLVAPPLGGLLVESAIDALEPAADGGAGGFVRKNVEPVGQDRVGDQTRGVVD